MDPPADAGATYLISRNHLTFAGNGSTLSALIKCRAPLPGQSIEGVDQMETRKKKALKALAVFLAFSFAQVYVQAGLPNPAPGMPAPQKAISGRLLTSGNKNITVNGNGAATGGTILTG